MYSPITMYLIEVLALVYISHLRQCKRAVQFATSRSRAFSQRWACAVCVSCSQYLLLPLAIVSECAGKLTASHSEPRDQQANLNMFVYPVASSHDQPIICPCNNFQGIMWETILLNYKAVIPSGLEWATGQSYQIFFF